LNSYNDKDPMDKMYLNIIEQKLVVDKIRWAVSMIRDVSRAEWDFGHMQAMALCNTFVRWPEQGTLTLTQPTTWWDHVKAHFKYKYYKWLSWVKYDTTTNTHKAVWVLPAVKLPETLLEGAFPVFFGGPTVSYSGKNPNLVKWKDTEDD
jgi:hypothetical protein